MPSLRIANIAFPIRDGKVSVQTVCKPQEGTCGDYRDRAG